ncbi:single-strand DNA-binding protein [Microbacterium sp. cf046]|uniref:single-stranded DNA-binding protein n=1 Tax=Microbacterium sp. cf046 TaxID=1761803 RepID=UPI0008F03412|nr:single-stranded DNA-binding protein [Microbacterium sp. cf046]SFS06137.1 single-strand DNA-binding protein [Microbacterium sp. cf046]
MSDTITIVGTVGTDPEKKTRNGVTITTFRLASRERRFDKATGAWVDGETNWYTVSAYRRLAEHVFDSVHRRDRVILTGRLHVRNWDNGEKRGTAVDVDADAIGHDLLFGTTAYEADERSSLTTSSTTEDGWAPADADQPGWTSPGVAPGADAGAGAGARASSESQSQPDEADQRPLALAGVEAPF